MYNFLEELSSQRILVIGDLMLDHYISGSVQRISPEAPVPVVHVQGDSWTAGGASNVALNLAGLGVEVSVLGIIGKDEPGDRLRDIFKERNVHLLDVEVPRITPNTIVKARIMANKQQLCRIDREQPISCYQLDDSADFRRIIRDKITDFDAVDVSDYAKGTKTQSLLDQLIELTASSGLFIAIDPKPSRELDLRGASLLTPNRSEALQLANLPAPEFDEPFPLSEVFSRIQERYSPKQLIVTLGADGMAVGSKGFVEKVLPTFARDVFDVSGAGDTVISTLTASIAAGASPDDAAHVANVAAGLVVSRMGTAAIKLNEVQKKLSEMG